MVRAKFYVASKSLDNGDGTGFVVLQPVVGGSLENDEFYNSTPAGNIRLEVVNAAAFAQFDVGKQYYVDFTTANT